MSSLLLKRVAVSKEAKEKSLRDAERAEHRGDENLSLEDDIAARLQRSLSVAEKYQLESSPRDTVLKMLMHKKCDEHFIFKTDLHHGVKYVQAMRMVLSRARAKALEQRQVLDEFKLFVIDIKSEADHDIVTLMRSKRMTAEESSVYDKITELFAKNPVNDPSQPK